MPTELRPRPLSTLLGALIAPAVWLERARGRRRLALALLYALVGAYVGLLTYRATRLAGLPDVGDPFDVEAFRRPEPAEVDAGPPYRRAAAGLKPPASMSAASSAEDWRAAGPEVRAWAAENGEALALWRLGAERPRMSYRRPEGNFALLGANSAGKDAPRMLAQLAVLEGSRLEEAGDLAGAWGWYRAVLRCGHHLGMRGDLHERATGLALHGMARRALVRWAADPRVDAAMLRGALDEAIALGASAPPASDLIKAEYLKVIERSDDFARSARRPGDELTWYGAFPALHWARWFLANEGERDRRLIRLLCANWLAHCDEPWSSRPMFTTSWRLSDDPDDPPAARALPPDRLAGQADAALIERYFYPPMVDGTLGEERRSQADLVLGLAEQWHFRRFGYVPTSPGALVGPCLDRLPEDYDPTVRPRPGPRPFLRPGWGTAESPAPDYDLRDPIAAF